MIFLGCCKITVLDQVLEYYSISIRIGSSISISIRLPRSGDLRCTVKGTPERCGCEDGVFVGGEADRGSRLFKSSKLLQ